MSPARVAFVLFFFAVLVHAQPSGGRGGAAAPAGRTPTIEERTAGMQKLDGYFPIYWDDRAGTVWLEIPRFDTDFLYTTGLAAGLGSNDIGLDRGQAGGARIVSFQRIGPKILMVQPNESFRSSSANPAERRSVEDSFAKSVLWGFTVAAESNGHVLVDATDFLLRDGHGASSSLRPGPYRVDRARSAVYMPRTKAFPKNTEIEVTLTFANDTGGGRGGFGGGPEQGPPPIGQGAGRGGRVGGLFSGTVASVTPTPDSVTLREHYSFVELPDNNFQPRYDDPRAGYGGLNFVDYSVPIGETMVKRYIRRHRLEKKDPNAAMSEAVKPIQYWVDSGAPEDVKKALLEGASWWNQAFEAAGYRNAFHVAVLPDGADPMDIRYNMINWVHRSTRGWSSGASVADPRTGEILKATVTLGSLRDRQDYLIFEGLLSPYMRGDEKPGILYQTALARIRQLAAHEVGHTLGLGHNYYDSTKGWISVMDYPHPLEKLRDDGTIDLSEAYAARIGDWDKVAINYGYRQLPKGDEQAALTKILDDAWAEDLRYMTNQDTDAHPRVDQWSNGVNQADELNRLMKIRRAALNRLGEHTIRKGEPMATIEEPLVPIFMYHRYSVESAASMVAGIDYIYAMRGDGRTPVKWETAANQHKALDALANTLKPSELAVPKQVLDAVPPRPPGFGRHRELFPRTTGDGFDPIHDTHFLHVIGRLKPGVSFNQGRAEIDAISARYHQAHPDDAVAPGANALPLQSALVRESRSTLQLLWAAVGCVLLIACVNVANLLLARASGRAREIAIRAATGASRSRLVRLFLIESILLAVCGAVLGLLLAVSIADVVAERAPGATAILPSAVPFDVRVFLFAFAAALVVGIASGLFPALQFSRADVARGLRDGGRSSTDSRAQSRFRGALAAVEVAVSLVLLIAAGLLLRSFSRLMQVNPGVRLDHTITIMIPFIERPDARVFALFRDLPQRLRSIPGVVGAGLTSCLPATGHCNDNFFYIDGRPSLPGHVMDALQRSTDPGYFSAIGLPLLRRRTFTLEDGIGPDRKHPQRPAIVVSESLAKTYFPGEDPIGRRLTTEAELQQEKLQGVPAPHYEIIGVVGDTPDAIDRKSGPTFYMPIADQTNYDQVYAVLHTTGDPRSEVAAARSEINRVDPDLAIDQIRTIRDLLGESASSHQSNTLLFGSFAALALFLAAFGLYSVLSYAVSQRRAEIGVRMALGASSSSVAAFILREGMKPTIVGMLVGLPAAAASCQVLKALLFGITPFDPATFILAPFVLLAVAALACYLPALRAARIDPAVSLRND